MTSSADSRSGGSSPLVLEELERDALQELFNLGIGAAAKRLSEMLQQEIGLHVPTVQMTTGEMLIDLFEETFQGDVHAIHQRFEGPFVGDSFLLFPQRRSLELVRALLPRETSLDELTELEIEALEEVGNVVQNACLGALANQLDVRLHTSLPTSRSGSIRQVLAAEEQGDPPLLSIQVHFTVQDSEISNYLVVMLGRESMHGFLGEIRKYVEQFA